MRGIRKKAFREMELLLEQFARCYDENGWFVAVRNAIEGLSAEQAAWKPEGADHAIRQLVAHLRHDAYATLQRFGGVEYKSSAASNDGTFTPSAESWQAEIDAFDSLLTESRGAIATADAATFETRVPGREYSTWGLEIADLNAHNAYHGGQILLLRKLQNAWNPEKGVS